MAKKIEDLESENVFNVSEISEKKDDEIKKSEVIEIPIGKYLDKIRENPWVMSSLVLGLVLIVVLLAGGEGSNGITGNVIGLDAAGENVLTFINSNPDLQGAVSLVSVSQEGQLYKIILNYDGQDVPVYTTMDGQFLVGNVVPLDLNLPDNNVQKEVEGQVAPVEVGDDDDAVLGNKDAPVTIIEFSDYQCPFCGKFWTETLPLIKKSYIDTGKVRLVYRDFPLSNIHPLAQKAAEAAECVRAKSDDETYFKMHDKIFGNQADLSENSLINWASELGYDISDCLDNGEFTSEVLSDLSDGQASGINGTPGFFVNGVPISGAQPYSVFKQIIEAKLTN